MVPVPGLARRLAQDILRASKVVRAPEESEVRAKRTKGDSAALKNNAFSMRYMP